MRQSRGKRQPHVRVAPLAGLVATLSLLALSLGEGRVADAIVLQPLAAEGSQAEGQRPGGGLRGPRGPRGPAGPRGETGLSGPKHQFISLNWQNNRYAGRDVQTFTAPGIGRGEVQCIPPQSPDGDKGDGRMRIQFFHDDGVKENPRKWATTMWVTRFGGNVDDANRRRRMVVKTNRIKRSDDNRSSFSESMDTAPIGQYDPESVGSFVGVITTEPFEDTTAEQPPPTTFRLSWHWNFRDVASSRCYVTGTFVTEQR